MKNQAPVVFKAISRSLNLVDCTQYAATLQLTLDDGTVVVDAAELTFSSDNADNGGSSGEWELQTAELFMQDGIAEAVIELRFSATSGTVHFVDVGLFTLPEIAKVPISRLSSTHTHTHTHTHTATSLDITTQNLTNH